MARRWPIFITGDCCGWFYSVFFNAYILLWSGDILYFYGLLGMLLYPFRRLKPGWLVVVALLCIGANYLRNDLWYSDMRENRGGLSRSR
jgi:hypothetical protein